MLRFLPQVCRFRQRSFLPGMSSSYSDCNSEADVVDYPSGVLKVIANYQRADYDTPWQREKTSSCSGSGVRIAGGLILTCAHVVADQTFIQLQKTSDPNRVVAELVAVSHTCDLAFLKIKDEDSTFLDDVTEFELYPKGFLPNLRDKVSVVGFPVGGDEVSITEGVVSRVEIQGYSHSDANLLAITIDAAINSGNSGGPVFMGNKILGVAVQSLNDAQLIGEIVPPPVIHHVLECLRKNIPLEVPSLGVVFQSLENAFLRTAVGLHGSENGILVKQVIFGSSSWNVLKEGDVILEVDSVPICNNGTVRFLGQYRTRFSVLFQQHFIGDALPLKIMRDKKRLDVEVKLKAAKNLVEGPQFDVAPEFFIYGGLVFQPLDRGYLRTWKKWQHTAPNNLLALSSYGEYTEERAQAVIFTDVLADDVNVGYSSYMQSQVMTVNGKKFRDLAEMITLVEDFSNADDIIEFKCEDHGRLLFNPRDVQERMPAIMERYHVPRDRSINLGECGTTEGLSAANSV